MTPEQEDALVERTMLACGFTSGGSNYVLRTSDEIRLAIRAAYAQGVAQERERCAYICDRWSGVGDVVARAIAAAIRGGE